MNNKIYNTCGYIIAHQNICFQCIAHQYQSFQCIPIHIIYEKIVIARANIIVAPSSRITPPIWVSHYLRHPKFLIDINKIT